VSGEPGNPGEPAPACIPKGRPKPSQLQALREFYEARNGRYTARFDPAGAGPAGESGLMLNCPTQGVEEHL
jgi:hypothetical protein